MGRLFLRFWFIYFNLTAIGWLVYLVVSSIQTGFWRLIENWNVMKYGYSIFPRVSLVSSCFTGVNWRGGVESNKKCKWGIFFFFEEKESVGNTGDVQGKSRAQNFFDSDPSQLFERSRPEFPNRFFSARTLNCCRPFEIIRVFYLFFFLFFFTFSPSLRSERLKEKKTPARS